MFKINNIEDLKVVSDQLKLAPIISKQPVEIIVSSDILFLYVVRLFDKQKAFEKQRALKIFFLEIAKITNNNFIINVEIEHDPAMTSNRSLLIETNEFKDAFNTFFNGLAEMKLQTHIKDLILNCRNWHTSNLEKLLSSLSEVFNENNYIKSINLITTSEVLVEFINNFESIRTQHEKLIYTLKNNAASLEKLQECMTKMDKLSEKILTRKKKLDNFDYGSDEDMKEEHKVLLNKTELELQKITNLFMDYAEILKAQNNKQVYYYLAKYQEEYQHSTDYKNILECLEKVPCPFPDDPKKDEHMVVYRAACIKKAHIYYDQEKYAQAKSLDLNIYSQKHNKEYVFPDTIESERIKSVVKYFLEGQDHEMAFLALHNYLTGSSVGNYNELPEEFGGLSRGDFEGKNFDELSWLIICRQKYQLDRKIQSTCTNPNLLFSKEILPQSTTTREDSVMLTTEEAANRNPNKRQRSNSPVL